MELPYTVDMKNGAVISYSPQVKSDPFMDFFSLIDHRKWYREEYKKRYEGEKQKLSYALQVPLVDQAKHAAMAMVADFVRI